MLFMVLLGTTLLISLLTSFIAVQIFRKPVDAILQRIVSEEMAAAWSKFLRFAVYVTGVSWGVDLWKLERYITAPEWINAGIIELTASRWVFETYRTVIETTQGVAWVLAVFFVCALIAYVLVRGFELRRKASKKDDSAREGPFTSLGEMVPTLNP